MAILRFASAARSWWLGAFAAALAAAQGTPSPPAVYTENLDVTAVTVAVRALDGRKPATALAAQDLEVLEDGVSCPVLSVARAPGTKEPPASAARQEPPPTPPAKPWRVLVYVDLQLAGVTSVRQAGWELGGRAAELTALGEVEVWIADDEAKRVFGPSRDAEALKKVLRKTVADNFGQRRLLRLRARFLEESQRAVGLVQRRGSFTDAGTESNLVRAYAVEETLTLELRRALLERVLAERSAPDWPQAALVVTGGYDLNPVEFYLPKAAPGREDEEARRLDADLRRWSQADSAARSARQYAALGWTVLTLLPYDQSPAFANSAQFDGSGAWNRMFSGGVGAGTAAAFLQLDPEAPWKIAGDTTGGEVLTDVRQLDDALARLGERWLVTYQVSRARDGSLRALELRPKRAGLVLQGPAFVSSGTAEAVAEARARALLAGGEERGELPVAARVESSAADERGLPGRVEARVEFAPIAAALAGLSSTTLRFTIAVPRPDGTVFVVHERAESADLTERKGWIFEARLVAPAGTSKVAVVVEELATGAWGGATAPWGS